MIEVDIAFALAGDLFRNSRALKQINSLTSAGYSVHVLYLAGASTPFPLPQGATAKAVSIEPGSGPAHFYRIHRAFSGVLASVSARLYHASDLYVLPACHSASDRFEGTFSYDAREYYPHVAATSSRPWARLWWSRIERKHIKKAAAVFTVSDSIADALLADYSIARPVLVQNFPDVTHLPAENDLAASDAVDEIRTHLGLGDQHLIVHLGQMKAARGCENLVRAMASVHSAHLAFLGYGRLEQKLKDLTAELDLTHRVHFLEPIHPSNILGFIRSADFGVTLLEDTCLNHRFALPNKLFDYINAGLPVLGSDLDEVRRLMSVHEIGMVADSSRPGDIAQKLKTMINSTDRKLWVANTKVASETFRWEYASQRMMSPINHLLRA